MRVLLSIKPEYAEKFLMVTSGTNLGRLFRKRMV